MRAFSRLRSNHRARALAAAVRTGAARARAYVRSAPGTYLWLAVLFVTTVLVHFMSPEFETEFLRRRSTNIEQLSTDPLRVLISSALWIDGGGWLSYAVLYSVFHAPAERWLGTLRWAVVAVTAHVLATFASQGALLWAIRHGLAPESAADTLDFGVSYALAGVVGVLVYHIAAPWRYVYLAGVLIVYGLPLVTGHTFTDLGHFVSVLIGLACVPLTRGRGPAWNPMDTVGRVREGLRRRKEPGGGAGG
ncbi:rhomboid-like protein [Streptomyces tsukubensis]|uniref:rhomboid-like protein n=1 Tax=Streptomyces tsukubensis TaxID=83656 RepID=UPI00344C2F94